MARRFMLKAEPSPEPRRFAIDYQAELNPQQLEAVTAPDGPVLVIAGAGTGKTRTLVYRVAYLVETGIPPEQIVLLTFTRRAAREMLTRGTSLLDGRCARVQGGTFHSFCLGILRRHAPRLGFPHSFSILDSSDAADVLDVIRTARGLHKSEKRFPRKRTLQAIISASANRGTSVEDILSSQYPQFLPYLEAVQVLQQAYADYKREYALMDYDDLLSQTLQLFEQDGSTRDAVASTCRHVLVDEYQDTNRMQAALVRDFASVHHNVMAVGDDAQSIYRFRGADTRNIFGFRDQFSGANVLKLEQNYRSTQPILNLANTLIGRASAKYEKELFTTRQEGDIPALVQAVDDRFESRFVCQMILQLREQGLALNRMAVLFRSSFNSFDLEVELNRRNIPFVKYGGMKLSEAAHVKDVLSYMKVAENPRDAVAWNRILQLLEGVGPKTAADLIGWITEAGTEPFELEERPYSPRYIEELKKLFAALRAVQTEERLMSQIEIVLNYYDPILKRKYFEDFPKRQQDLEHFGALAEGFGSRAEFLSSLALDPIELSALEAEPVEMDEPPLVLSTIHSAKGLEFHSVFVIHALEGVLPSSYALKDADELDEELRLLYVAVTRAEENLFISYPVTQYRRFQGEYFSRPSRFVEQLPEHILEPWTLIEESEPARLPQGAERVLPERADSSDPLPF